MVLVTILIESNVGIHPYPYLKQIQYLSDIFIVISGWHKLVSIRFYMLYRNDLRLFSDIVREGRKLEKG